MKQATLMRRSTVLSFPLQLVFLGLAVCCQNQTQQQFFLAKVGSLGRIRNTSFSLYYEWAQYV
jgi:hypothetical protein